MNTHEKYELERLSYATYNTGARDVILSFTGNWRVVYVNECQHIAFEVYWMTTERNGYSSVKGIGSKWFGLVKTEEIHLVPRYTEVKQPPVYVLDDDITLKVEYPVQECSCEQN